LGKRIDYAGQVGEVFDSSIHGKAKVIEYLGKDDKKKHMFKIKFMNTDNHNIVPWNALRSGKFRDIELLKQIKIKNTTQKLKERNRLIKKSKIKYNLTDLDKGYLLSIDFATKYIGVSLFEDGEHLISREYHADGKLPPRERVSYLVDKILDIIKFTGNEVKVVIEDIYLGLNSKILVMLAEARGQLIRELVKRKIRVEFIPATVVRHYFKAPINRNDIKKWAIEVYKQDTGIETTSDDLADSYILGKFAVRGVNNGN